MHKFDNFFLFKAMLHFPSGIRIYICSMILRIMFFRWALVDDKPKILLDILHAINRDLYQAIYSIISILLILMGAISNKQDL